MPVIEGVAYSALAMDGYRTLLPDVKGAAAAWAEELDLPQSHSTTARLFCDVKRLAGELAALDKIGLELHTRPEKEITARRQLEAAFTEKRKELIVFFPNGLHSLRGEIPANAGIHSPFPVRY